MLKVETELYSIKKHPFKTTAQTHTDTLLGKYQRLISLLAVKDISSTTNKALHNKWQ